MRFHEIIFYFNRISNKIGLNKISFSFLGLLTTRSIIFVKTIRSTPKFLEVKEGRKAIKRKKVCCKAASPKTHKHPHALSIALHYFDDKNFETL